jgi:chemotaxis protein methyltransferase CheR
MRDTDCVSFLQWVLPQLQMRWPGFRRVRSQVCKRIQRRMDDLSCPDAAQYRTFLQAHPEEWPVLDALCRVTVTRFYRDTQVFALLVRDVLPDLARAALQRHVECLRVWCVGCASGEEPYTLSIAWQLELAARFPQLACEILATDADAELLTRAAQACYGWSAVRNLPPDWRAAAFETDDSRFCLKPAFKTAVHFLQQDVRTAAPPGDFALICCRNLAFTYFETELQVQVAETLYDRLVPGGVLLLGVREQLPEAGPRFQPLSERLALFRRPL